MFFLSLLFVAISMQKHRKQLQHFNRNGFHSDGNKNSHLQWRPHKHNYISPGAQVSVCSSLFFPALPVWAWERQCVCVCVAVFQFTLFPISSACRIFSLMPWCSSAKNSVFKTIHNVIPSSKSGSLTICYGKHAKKRNRTENENTKANKLNKCILTSFTILSVARSFLSLSSATGYKMSVCLCVCESVSKYVCIFWKLGIL